MVNIVQGTCVTVDSFLYKLMKPKFLASNPVLSVCLFVWPKCVGLNTLANCLHAALSSKHMVVVCMWIAGYTKDAIRFFGIFRARAVSRTPPA